MGWHAQHQTTNFHGKPPYPLFTPTKPVPLVECRWPGCASLMAKTAYRGTRTPEEFFRQGLAQMGWRLGPGGIESSLGSSRCFVASPPQSSPPRGAEAVLMAGLDQASDTSSSGDQPVICKWPNLGIAMLAVARLVYLEATGGGRRTRRRTFWLRNFDRHITQQAGLHPSPLLLSTPLPPSPPPPPPSCGVSRPSSTSPFNLPSVFAHAFYYLRLLISLSCALPDLLRFLLLVVVSLHFLLLPVAGGSCCATPALLSSALGSPGCTHRPRLPRRGARDRQSGRFPTRARLRAEVLARDVPGCTRQWQEGGQWPQLLRRYRTSHQNRASYACWFRRRCGGQPLSGVDAFQRRLRDLHRIEEEPASGPGGHSTA
ncbi:hypothetical protein C8Q73DRAFT_685902 [Cubamyces lactineus]|nr:hypothetical protein C8Q73DRAFT_685902 [Cubamyces lactineus]